MLTFEQVNQKKWLVKSGKISFELDLVPSTITNKFKNIADT